MPAVIFPVLSNINPVTLKLLAKISPVALIIPELIMLPPYILLLAVIIPLLLTLPEEIIPLTLNEVNVPTLVILDCALLVTVLAIVAVSYTHLTLPTIYSV